MAWWRFIRNYYIFILLAAFTFVQVWHIAAGDLAVAPVLSATEDDIALQGKDPSDPRQFKDPRLAGRNNAQAGVSSDNGPGGIPIAFGENAPDVLPARVGTMRNIAPENQEGFVASNDQDLAGNVGGAQADGDNGGQKSIAGLSNSESIPRLLAAKLADFHPPLGKNQGVPGSEGNGGIPGAMQPGASQAGGQASSSFHHGRGQGVPGASGRGATPGAVGQGGQPAAEGNFGQAVQGDWNSAHPDAPKPQRVLGKPQKVQTTFDSGSSYERGLRIIYQLERRGGKYALTREQALYALQLIKEVESVRLHEEPNANLEVTPVKPEDSVRQIPPDPEKQSPKEPKKQSPKEPKKITPKQPQKQKPNDPKKYVIDDSQNHGSQDKDSISYRRAYQIIYALEAKGGKYALTDQQVDHLLRMIDKAEGQKNVVPNAQRDLPRILTPAQQSYIRAQLSAQAAQGKRTDPSLLNTYADEVLRLIK